MAYFDDIDLDIFNLGDLGTFQSRDVTDSIVSFNVSLSISGSSQVSVGVLDPNFTFASANYFQVRRDIFYRNIFFEISAVEVQRSDAIHPLYTLECRSKAVQLMKRDKKPEAYRGMTGFQFASAMAKRFGLKFVGEQTTKKQSIVKGKSRNADDSVWTVLQSLAGEQKFVCFESEGTLFFCSEQFLLGKWGDPKCTYGDFKFIPFVYPEATSGFFQEFKDKYILLEMPTIRRSDDDIKAADGTLVVDRFNGIYLRPGMTIYLEGIPDFQGFYIISDVSFEEGTPDPVRVNFRVPVDPNKESISSSTASGSSATAGTSGGNKISDPTDDESRLPTIISVTGSRQYTSKALELLRYRGPNASVITKAVSESVRRMIQYPKSTIAKERSILGAYPGLSVNEKEFAEIIFVWYLSGKKIEILGTAGGLSSNALEQTADAVERQTSTSTTSVSLETSVAATQPQFRTADQQSRLGNVTRRLSNSTLSAIRKYIDSYAPPGTTIVQKGAAKSEAIKKAQNIFLAPTNSAKQDLFRKYKRSSGSSFTKGFTLEKAIYNSIRQESVLRDIYPTSTKISASELNATVPPRWSTTG